MYGKVKVRKNDNIEIVIETKQTLYDGRYDMYVYKRLYSV